MIESMIQIEKYFFEVVNYNVVPIEVGNTNVSFSGKNHIDYINKYHKFELSMTNLSSQRHSQLLFLVNKNRGEGFSEPSNLRYVDLNGKEYTVDIPIEGYDYNLEKGEGETYAWDLTLVEV